MSAQKMHDDEIDIDERLVQRLITAEFPRWSTLPIRRVPSTGTVNAVFRLGTDMVVRLPLTPRWHDVEAEVRWLDHLRPRLPLPIPEPLGIGEPVEGYLWRWGVFRWLDGETWRMDAVTDPCAAAVRLAEFLQVLHAEDWTALPTPPPVRTDRFQAADEAVRTYAEKARGIIDVSAVLEAWEEALEIPDRDEGPVLVHGDLLAANVLIRDGELSAVIDWAGLHAGDPARDLTPAWALFSGESRVVFREAMGLDSDAWRRARGMALGAIIGAVYYAETNPGFAADMCHTLSEAMSDGGRGGPDSR